MIATIALCATTALATGGLAYACIRLRVSRFQIQRANLRVTRWRTKALSAQCQLDVIHQQHVDAGLAAHAKFKIKRAETTEALRRCVEARNEIPGPDQQRPKRAERSGMCRPHRQDAAGSSPPARLAKGDSIDPGCRLAKPRGVIPPLLTPNMKGAI